MRIKVLQFRHGRARLLPSRGVKKRFFFRYALILLGLALALMIPRLGWGLPACTCARFNDWKDLGCHKPPGGGGSPSSSMGGKAQGNDSKCPTCPSPQGMPRWWVDEPYINLHVVDEPYSYNTSSGQKMEFDFFYKQRFQLPQPDQVPNLYDLAGDLEYSRTTEATFYGIPMGQNYNMTNAWWSGNWAMQIELWDYDWEGAYWHLNGYSGQIFQQDYEAVVYLPNGGTSYFNNNVSSQTVNPYTFLTDPGTGIQLQSRYGSYPILHEYWIDTNGLTQFGNPTNGIYWGDPTNGLQMVYPDGSKDSLVTDHIRYCMNIGLIQMA